MDQKPSGGDESIRKGAVVATVDVGHLSSWPLQLTHTTTAPEKDELRPDSVVDPTPAKHQRQKPKKIGVNWPKRKGSDGNTPTNVLNC